MVFSTPVFLFAFLIFVLGIYYITPLRFRNAVLLLSSLLFYFWGEQSYTVIMLLSTVVDYVHGLLVDRCKRRGRDRGARIAVASSVIFNLGILFFFKYWDFLARTLASAGLPVLPELGISLPIGISFYTFQTMSYTIDVYRGDAKVQRNPIHFGTFVTLFPQLIAGPIIKYKDLGEQIDRRSHTLSRFASGVQLFVIGLGKKLLLANNVGQLWESVRTLQPTEMTVAGAWLGIFAFALQIYFDFSGYSDMAVGLGRMLGFEFPKNFRYPYLAKSIRDFWHRWHISLSTWFRDYLYIPLGGNRRGKGRWLLNLLIVWAATGLWHGASWNFLLWGLYFFCLLAAEKCFLQRWLDKIPSFLQHAYALLMILLGWVIFAVEDLSQLGNYFSCMFGFGRVPFWNETVGYYLRNYLPVLLIAVLGATPLSVGVYGKLPPKIAKGLALILLAAGMLLCAAYAVAGTYDPFLYFRF